MEENHWLTLLLSLILFIWGIFILINNLNRKEKLFEPEIASSKFKGIAVSIFAIIFGFIIIIISLENIINE